MASILCMLLSRKKDLNSLKNVDFALSFALDNKAVIKFDTLSAM